METEEKKIDSGIMVRWEWLDILKGIAIMAVVLDHFVYLFPKTVLRSCWEYSFFSVGLFVFLSGITAAMSYEKHGDASLKGVCKRLPHILIPYVCATFLYQLFFMHFHFDFITFFKHLIFFNAFPQLYFVFFFLQLMLIAPVCFRLLFGKRQISAVWLPPVLILLVVFSLWTTLYTSMLPLHGAGQNLLGGFFMVHFVLGLIFYKYRHVAMSWKIAGSAFVIFVFAYVFLRRFTKADMSSKCYSVFLAANPAGIYYTTYIFAVFFGFLLVWFGLNLLRKHSFWKKTGDFFLLLLSPLAACGRNSYVIFLFHMIPLFLLQKNQGLLPGNISGQVVLIAAGLLIPPLFSILLGWIGRKIRELLFSPMQ